MLWLGTHSEACSASMEAAPGFAIVIATMAVGSTSQYKSCNCRVLYHIMAEGWLLLGGPCIPHLPKANPTFSLKALVNAMLRRKTML